MIKALVIKELRESLGLIALAGLGIAYIVGHCIGIALLPWKYAEATYYPFSYGLHIEGQVVILGCFGFLLGLKQTAWEAHHSTFYFLLHRPVERSRVFAVKLLVGVLIVFLLNALLIGLYGWWAASPGKHPSPFEWSMTIPTWKLSGALVIVYLGAFLSGVRPAKWFGTRLVPTVFGIVCAVSIHFSPWWWRALPIGLASATVLLLAIFYYVQTRDY